MHVAQVTAEEAVDEAKRQGLTPGALVDKAKRVASELQTAAKDVAQREEIHPSSIGEKVKAVAEHAKETAKQELDQQQKSLQETNV
jgi:hypothetical protein